MNSINMGLDNIIAADGLGIAVTGMLIVFAALALIATVIALIPRFLPLLDRVIPEEHHHGTPSSSQPKDHEKVLAAIAHALFHKETGSLPSQ